MNSPNYCFLTHWQVEGTCEDIYNTLKNTTELPRWWRAVYLDVVIREKGDADGRNKAVERYTKGWLPYTIRWQFRVFLIKNTEGVLNTLICQI